MDFVKLKPRKRSSVGNVRVQVVRKLMRECMVDIYMVWKRLVTLSLIWKRYGSIHVLATNYFQRILFFLFNLFLFKILTHISFFLFINWKPFVCFPFISCSLYFSLFICLHLIAKFDLNFSRYCQVTFQLSFD